MASVNISSRALLALGAAGTAASSGASSGPASCLSSIGRRYLLLSSLPKRRYGKLLYIVLSTYQPRYRVGFTNGWADLDPAFAGLRMKLARKIREKAEDTADRDLQQRNQFALEMTTWPSAFEKRQPHTPGEEGLQNQRLMECIYRAASETVKLAPVSGKDVFRGPLPSS